VLEARSALDLVVADEEAITGWDRVLKEGAAKWPVHPTARPDITLLTYGIDLREVHGVVLTLTVFASADSPDEPRPNLELPDVAPRFATLCKDPRLSIGVAWSSGEGADADELVAQADNAMYESKREGAGLPKLAASCPAP